MSHRLNARPAWRAVNRHGEICTVAGVLIVIIVKLRSVPLGREMAVSARFR